MLITTLKVYKNVDISKYWKTDFLPKMEHGHISQERQHIELILSRYLTVNINDEGIIYYLLIIVFNFFMLH